MDAHFLWKTDDQGTWNNASNHRLSRTFVGCIIKTLGKFKCMLDGTTDETAGPPGGCALLLIEEKLSSQSLLPTITKHHGSTLNYKEDLHYEKSVHG